MRKITVISMITLDGVLQAPGGPKEDPSGDFNYGGWVAPYDDTDYDQTIAKLMAPADVLLGRKTYDIWVDYWPQHAEQWPGINEVTKYVVSKTLTLSDEKITCWPNVVLLKSDADIKELKATNGSDIQVWGSGNLLQTLLSGDLVDELRLLIHPLTLGKGKKLFMGGSIPAAFSLVDSNATSKGVLIAHYKRNGAVKTGTVGA